MSAAGRLSQIWNSSTGLGPVTIAQRKHLGVDDAPTGGEPLHVAAAEARRRAERVGMIDEALAHDRHGLEAAMRMLRKPGHDVAVVHAPAVLALEVLAHVRPASEASGPIRSFPFGYASS